MVTLWRGIFLTLLIILLRANASPTFAVTNTALSQEQLAIYNPILSLSTLCNAATLNAAVTAIGSSRQALLLSARDGSGNACVWTIDANVTVPPNITLLWPDAARMTLNAGRSVTYNGGCAQWPAQTLFTGTGTFVFGPQHSCTEVLPQWDGAVTNDGEDDWPALLLAQARDLPMRFTPGVWNLDQNALLYGPIVRDAGAILTPAAGMTLTIQGPIQGPEDQAFNANETTTGAVRFLAGTLQTIPATWFGMRCDGTTNNSPAVLAAINSTPTTVAAQNLGAKVTMPAGICNFSTPLVPTKPVHLIGAGAGRVNAGRHGQTRLNYTGTGTFITITGQPVSGSVLEGFDIDHNPSGTAAEVAIDIDNKATGVYLEDVTVNMPTTPFSIAGIRLGKTEAMHSTSFNRVFVRSSAPSGLLCEDVESGLFINDSTFHHHSGANIQFGRIGEGATGNCKEVQLTNSRSENTTGGDAIVIGRGEFINIRGGHFEMRDPLEVGTAIIRVPPGVTSNRWLTISNSRFQAHDPTVRAIVLEDQGQIITLHHNVFGGDTTTTNGFIWNILSKAVTVTDTFLDVSTRPLIATTGGSTIENVNEQRTFSQGGGQHNGFVPYTLCQNYDIVSSVGSGAMPLATCTIPANTFFDRDGLHGLHLHAFGNFDDDTDNKRIRLLIDDFELLDTGAFASAAGSKDYWNLTCTLSRTSTAGLQYSCSLIVDDDQSPTETLLSRTISDGTTLATPWTSDILITLEANGTNDNDVIKRGFSVDIRRGAQAGGAGGGGGGGGDGSGTDPDAIHDNVAGEIAALLAKDVLVGGDLFLIEDSADGHSKKRVSVSSLVVAAGGNVPTADDQLEVADAAAATTWRTVPNCHTGFALTYNQATNTFGCEAAGGTGGADADAIHDNVAGEIAALADKATPVGADHLLIEDSAAGNAKKDVTLGSIPLSILGGAVTDAQVPNTITVNQATSLTDGLKGDFTCTAGNCTITPGAVDLTVDTTGNYVAGATTGQGLLQTGTEAATLGLIACTTGQILKNTGGAWGCGADDTGAGGSDSAAIHDDQANEIVAVADKATPVAADHLLIEDSAAGNVKKDITIGSLVLPLNALLSLSTIPGSVTDAQVPDTLTVNQAAELTDGNKGDFTCTAGNCQIAADSVVLGTDTTGDYVAGVTAGQGLLKTGTEAATLGLIPCTTGQILKNTGGTSWACATEEAGGAGTDTTAIHGTVAGELAALPVKTTPVVGDLLLIEDSAAANVKKRITVGSLPSGGTDAAAIHTNVAGEIAALTDKATPGGADHLLIEDSAAANAKKDIMLGNIPLSILAGSVTDAQVPDTLTVTLAATATALSANRANCSAGNFPLGTDELGAAESCTPAAQALACPGTEKFRAYNATTGAFTCAADELGTGGGGDITTAVSLATSHYEGDTDFGTCTWTDPDTTVHVCACDAAKTTCYTSHIPMYADAPLEIQNAAGEACQTIDQVTGLVTYHGTGGCVRPTIAKPFDASAFNVGAGVTLESVALNGWPASPALDGPDSDAGLFSLVIPLLWDDFAGNMTLQLTCHSLTNQNGLTLMARVGPAVCTATGEALPAFVAPTSGTPLTCAFGAQPQEVQLSNIVTLATSGCVPGKKMHIPLVSEADMTASWSVTTGLITGVVLRYDTAGTAAAIATAPLTPVLDDCNRTEPTLSNGGVWAQHIDLDEVGIIEATGTTCSKSAAAGAGSIYSTASYGPDMEAYFTVASAAATGQFHLYIRLTEPGTASPAGPEGIAAAIDEAADTLTLMRVDNGSHNAISAAVVQETAIGDVIILRGIGESIALLYCPGGTNCVVKATADEALYNGAGSIGLRSNTQANLFDSIGGGTLP